MPWKPFSEIDKFFGDEEWLLPVFPGVESLKPAMDVYETEKEVVAKINLPGFDPKKVEVTVEKGILKVSGKMEEKEEEKKKGYWRKEIRQGSFERVTRLPAEVKEDAVKATYEKGVLKIVMPKMETKPSSKVKVEVEEK